MNSVKVTTDNVRLDQVAFQYYGNLKNFDEVVGANDHITTVFIPKDEVVYLPEQEITSEKDDELW